MQNLTHFLKRSAVVITRRPMAGFANEPWNEREQAQEKNFFNKEEERLLKKLSSRLQQERYVSESGKTSQDFRSEQIRRIKEIFNRYRVNCDNDAVFDELYSWKYEEE